MAKLGTFYALCPLIDNKEIFGIAEDTSRSNVIATLGRNIAGIYKISDQRQLFCWRTKEKFSSPILYDKKQSKYVAVFNQSYIKLWYTEDNLDKVKKFKFNKQIYTIVSDQETTYVVFEKGDILKLEDAIEKRKEINSNGISADYVDVIQQKVGEQFYLGIMTKAEGYSLHWTVFPNSGGDLTTIPLERDGLSLSGYVFHAIEDAVCLLTFWSDGSVFSCNLDSSIKNPTVGELFTVIDSISTKYQLSALSLDENYLAIYGAAANEEGATLVIYNTQFKVTQTKQPFKLFTNNSKIWRINSNLFLPVGQNLAVIPFYLEVEQLAALVGSHTVSQEDTDVDVKLVHNMEVVSWDEKYCVKQNKINKGLHRKIEELAKQGLPESSILENILPEMFEKNNLALLSRAINYFCDMPEKYLVNILKYLLHLDSKHFKGETISIDSIPSDLQPLGRIELINSVLSKSFTDELLIPHLRTGLDLDDVILLINYISSLWSIDTIPTPEWAVADSKLLEWSCALIDSNYQKIILSKEETLLKTFENLRDIVTHHLNTLQDLKSLEPYLIAYKKGTLLNLRSSNVEYSIERVVLY